MHPFLFGSRVYKGNIKLLPHFIYRFSFNDEVLESDITGWRTILHASRAWFSSKMKKKIPYVKQSQLLSPYYLSKPNSIWVYPLFAMTVQECVVKKITECSGEATACNRKGKVKCWFDFKLKVCSPLTWANCLLQRVSKENSIFYESFRIAGSLTLPFQLKFECPLKNEEGEITTVHGHILFSEICDDVKNAKYDVGEWPTLPRFMLQCFMIR